MSQLAAWLSERGNGIHVRVRVLDCPDEIMTCARHRSQLIPPSKLTTGFLQPKIDCLISSAWASKQASASATVIMRVV